MDGTPFIHLKSDCSHTLDDCEIERMFLCDNKYLIKCFSRGVPQPFDRCRCALYMVFVGILFTYISFLLATMYLFIYTLVLMARLRTSAKTDAVRLIEAVVFCLRYTRI